MSAPRPDPILPPPSAARLRAMRCHFQREGAGRRDDGCDYLLELEAGMAELDGLRFAYVVMPGAVGEAGLRAIDGDAGSSRSMTTSP